ncbi:hypothetical protein ABEB36_011395 [Hypothenemus hampei]|uniref:Uncharacterized protein n=1 Tax=Hypothenemus hampei TaxID=57062 RepID=A0ABD1EFL4_HYPHA
MHNIRPKKTTQHPDLKHLNCNAKLTITTMKKNKDTKKTKDLQKYINHNHELYNLIIHHFKNWKKNLSHSPSTAFSLFKDKLLLMDINGCTIYSKRSMENPLEMK